jgi:hypothetical protein
MKKEKAMEWVKALRSGNYQQGQARLKFKNDEGEFSYCCLGVLGEISGVDSQDLEIFSQLYTHEMQEKAGITSWYGTPTSEDKINVKIGNRLQSFASLAHANDRGATFKEIANWIEKNYELL